MKERREARAHWISAIMFTIAGVVFFLTALLGDADADTAFFVLAMVFIVLALNARRTGHSTSEVTDRQEESN